MDAVAFEHLPGEVGGEAHQVGRAGQEGALPLQVVVAHVLVEVVGHRLVLGFLDGMPDPQVAHRGMHFFHQVRATQNGIGENRGDVLQTGRGCQLLLLAHVLAGAGQQFAGYRQSMIDDIVVLAVGNQIIEGLMLQGVHGFLADKTGDVFLAVRAFCLVAQGANGIHEETLAIREGQRHHVQHMGEHRVIVEPVGLVFQTLEGEPHATRGDADSRCFPFFDQS